MPTINSFIRFLHASPGAPAVDIYTDGNLVAENVAYNEISEYLVVGPESMLIQVFVAGDDTTPLINTEVDIPASSAITIAIIGIVPDISLLPIFFDAGPTTSKAALIRFANLSPTSIPINVTIEDGATLFSGVGYPQVTDFEPIAPGTYTIELREPNENQIITSESLTLESLRAYTIYAIGLAEGEPPVEIGFYQDQIPFIGENSVVKTEFSKPAGPNTGPVIRLIYK